MKGPEGRGGSRLTGIEMIASGERFPKNRQINLSNVGIANASHQQLEDIKNLYRTYKNLGINLEGSGSAGEFLDDSGGGYIMPTVKFSHEHKTTATILPPLP
jgi:hypothetical protein